MHGIYIPGMEMPTDDMKNIMILADGRVFQFSGYGNPKPLGTAVHVPPHGRLGDLDKLVEKIDGIWDCNDMVFKPNDHCCNIPEDCKGCKWVETKNFIRRMVTNAPTIIPAEPEKENEQ